MKTTRSSRTLYLQKPHDKIAAPLALPAFCIPCPSRGGRFVVGVAGDCYCNLSSYCPNSVDW